MGIFGFLSKAHSDQSLVSGDVLSKIAIYDEKIKTARENIEANRKQLKQMDEAFDQVMGRSSDEKGADKANSIRRSQQRDRANLAKDIESNQKIISQLNDESAPIRAEVRKVEAEVGPIKYIAKFIYGEHGADENMLEKAVTWIIILIVVVFDPLAVIMLLAAQMTFQWHRDEKKKNVEGDSPPGPIVDIVSPDTTVTEQEETIQSPDEDGAIERTVFEPKERDKPEPFTPDSKLWPFPGVEDKVEEPQLTAVEQWNSMIAAAEKEAAEEAAKWAEENKEEPEAQEAKDWAEEVVTTPPADFPPAEDESKKKDQLHDQIARTLSNQGEEVGYVQNGEQGESTLWARIQQRSVARSKDELYKLYGVNKFADITVDATIDPDLAKFVEETQTKGPKFSNYSNDKLESFVERIYELRKNQSNNAAG
jgi:hypothetical protein